MTAPRELGGAAIGLDGLSRRTFFKLMGAGATLAGLGACSSRPAREIRPYVKQPPEVTPGVPRYFATALVEDGFATGVVVESHEGRPTKLEGNPDHPASLGATRAIEQAAALSLYDPQRAQQLTDHGVPTTWDAIARVLGGLGARGDGGAGVHVVLEPTTSPIVIDLVARVRAALPAAIVTWWSPLSPRASLAGNRVAFGRALQTQLDLRAADVVVALDADIVGDHPMALAYARALADRRRVIDAHSPMNRLYAIEPAYTATGVLADHRIRARGVDVERIALELLAELGGGTSGGGDGELDVRDLPRADGERARWIGAIARDLLRVGPRSAVIAGERQPARVHAIVAAINARLGNTRPGGVVAYTEPVAFEAGTPTHELATVADALDRRTARAVIVVGGNPVYTAPADHELAHTLVRATAASVPTLYAGLYVNETAVACRYVVPLVHALEDWDLARAYDGTLAPIQPLIEPLFDGRAVADVLAALVAASPDHAPPTTTPRERARTAWERIAPGADFDAALALGCSIGSAAPRVDAQLDVAGLAPALAAAAHAVAPPAFELDLRAHPMLHDGRYANNAWLQELPEPITKLTWDNAAQVSPATAGRLGVDNGDVIALLALGREVIAPAIIVPGHADDSITLHLGYGRAGDEAIARGIGVNAFALWRGAFQLGVAASRRVGLDARELAITQGEWGMQDRPIALASTLADLDTARVRDELAEQRGAQPSLYASRVGTGAQWAMSIDLTTCTGCSACVMACAAENNTPVVGRERVASGRAMHWLRIDRYAEPRVDGDADLRMQPMACQHCEDAPCEYVCPVGATTHSPDGLNEMAYNRCVGTRFCSNNCPYKVRRFNWFDFKQHTGLQVLGRNPDVTVRDRGVMEKCTYCVQRIRRTEIDARIAGGELGGPGAPVVRTACQQACPTQAIAFGSLTDPTSAVVEQRRRPQNYEVLHDQGTRPRTTYLARIRNLNPEMG